MEGKLCRVRADLPRAAQLFRRESTTDDGDDGVEQDGADDDGTSTRWTQLEHLMDYELAWCLILIGDYKAGGELFGGLATSTNWSRAFYAYLQAGCLFAMGDTQQAMAVLGTVPALVKKRFGGRLIPAEQYVLRKHKQLTENPPPADKPWANLILELIYIWNGFHQLDAAGRARAIEQLEEAEAAARTRDEKAVIQVALASVLREHGSLDAAVQALDRIDESIKDDRYAVVFSWYERAVTACYHSTTAGKASSPSSSSSSANDGQSWLVAESWLKRASEAEGYDFDNRLHLRVQLLRSGIAEAQNAN
ncbi:hypothetical protein SYNPS1DRAFT_28664 [Syncephalis pseudoplumigaleata]|uniref:Uncharacterized protein n=1 Tax=Syncephalis pseudoplumigaleata TaxID=1712513 RepID=A0A4V1J1M8_9FUNG|nr:hypothetical protein SYNPS1DRAFT_28664 [Syncephalis pseudoplumigaleata]|eukprot:RKP25609.1 hypothetical protein SYNPS1DRAFT_28664 [Syncephalis pseudoplumigaleata]